MKNTIIVIIISGLMVVGLGAFIAIICLSNSSYGKETFSMGDYEITVKAKRTENMNSNSYFTTEFKTKSDYIYKYKVEFEQIKESKRTPGIIYDLRAPDITIEVNGRDIYGYYESEDQPSSMTIYYYIEDSDDYIIINVKGTGIYTRTGSQLKMMPDISKDKKLEESKDLKRILDFEIEKELVIYD